MSDDKVHIEEEPEESNGLEGYDEDDGSITLEVQDSYLGQETDTY